MRRLIPAFAAVLLAAPAWADSMPNLIPAHDVSGSYLVTGQNGPKTVTVEYSKSANTLRLSPQDGSGYLLYDFSAKDAKMVLPQMQRYMDQPAIAGRAAALQNGGGNGDDTTITKGPAETIAGLTCTDYSATDKTRGTTSTLCVTDDGILLKLASPGSSAIAQTITTTPVPTSDVTVPAGYTEFAIPQMPGGMAMPPGMALPAQ